MKEMKKVLLAAVLFFTAVNVQASLITVGSGDISMISNVFFDTDVPAVTIDGPVNIQQGVGSVQQIIDSSGTVWDAGSAGSELNFFFTGLILDNFQSTPIVNVFANVLGSVSFWENDLGTFQATGNFGQDAVNIGSGTNLLNATGHPVDPNGWTVTGSSNTTGIGGNGNLDLINGPLIDNFVQDTISLSDASLADMSFNFSGDKLNTNGYNWSGSADFATVSTVPLPGAIWLFGIGLVSLVGFKRAGA